MIVLYIYDYSRIPNSCWMSESAVRVPAELEGLTGRQLIYRLDVDPTDPCRSDFSVPGFDQQRRDRRGGEEELSLLPW